MTSREKVANVWRGLVICAGIPIFLEAATSHSHTAEVLGIAVLFLGAPLYTLSAGGISFVGLFAWLLCADVFFAHDTTNGEMTLVLWPVFLAVEAAGYLWVGAKVYISVNDAKKQREWQEVKRMEMEEVERKRKDEERQSRESRNREAAWVRAKEAQIQSENSELLDQISQLLSSCGEPANQMILAARALGSADVADPWQVVLLDVSTILRVFIDVYRSESAYISGLWRAVKSLNYASWSLDDLENRGVKQLVMVSLLAMYDTTQGTKLASRAASTYLSLVSAVSSHCGNSIAGQVVVDSYVTLLKPYLQRDDGDAWRSSTNSTNSRTVCNTCIKGFELLGIAVDASSEDVRHKRRALAEVLHPDQLASKSQNARHAAEEHLKTVNAACDHILECRLSGTVS